MAETLTACVIVRDEERRLPDCLASLGFCDQVVVVDSGSEDRTVELARAAGADVVENPWPGFAIQRNVAIDHARGDWIVEIDADERVTPELAASIRALLADPPPEVRMAALPMRDIFLGGPLGPSSRYPRYRHRLFRRGAFRHDESRTVHEGLWPDGPTAALEGDLVHLLAGSWSEAVDDALAYARLEGQQRGRPGPKEAVVGIVARPLAKLFYRLFPYGAWRDGWRGLLKVLLECGSDSLATAFRLLRSGDDGLTGLGQEPPRLGPVRLVAVALGADTSARLTGWLAEAAGAGADVALITDVASDGRDGVRRRVVKRASSGELLRALDAEEQLRPIDALVFGSAREQGKLRLAPDSLRGVVAPLGPDRAPTQAVRDVLEQTRAGNTT